MFSKIIEFYSQSQPEVFESHLNDISIVFYVFVCNHCSSTIHLQRSTAIRNRTKSYESLRIYTYVLCVYGRSTLLRVFISEPTLTHLHLKFQVRHNR